MGRLREGWHDDGGRFPIGAVLTIAILGLAGYGAYWFLGEQGFLGEPGANASPTAVAESNAAADDRPEWLQGTDHVMPAATVPEDERLPQAYLLEPWVWELVDDDWDLAVVRVGEGDQYTWFSDIQDLYLIAPTGEHFKVTGFDTTVNRDVVHWAPERRVAWIIRADGSGWEQVIEFDLLEERNSYDFAGSAVSTANRVDGGIVNIDYVGDQSDGLELWLSYDNAGKATGLLWRDGDAWVPSLVTGEIGRMVLQGFTKDLGVDAWLDPASGRAVFHGVYLDPDTGTLADQQWVVHDLLTDVFTDDAVVATPSDDCAPSGEGRAGTFEGDRIVATCGGGEYLLDPYELTEPQAR